MSSLSVDRVPYALRAEVSRSGCKPRDIVMEAIRSTPSVTAAAMKLGVSADTLWKWKKRYGIDADSSC